MRIIPAIDLLEGQCVRLYQGDYRQVKVYQTDPVAMARQLEAEGFRYLHLVDLDGARSQQPAHLKVLEKIAQQTKLVIDFGGGMKTKAYVKAALEAGAQQVTLGSVAVEQPLQVLEWAQELGPKHLLIGADVRAERLATQGWQTTTETSLWDFVRYFFDTGLTHFVCTDIQRDGAMGGSAYDLYAQLLDRFSGIQLVASGGVSSLQEIEALQALGLEGAIVGKALYEGVLTANDLAPYVD
ncbi:MAG: 1-(5-phosphoribosyl)-5-[(5-phosphoribosylamino)methylideneamino]imidazole-4-carboxamide isomerase [Salibacteraceae bacterium]